MQGIFSFTRPSIPFGPETDTITSGGGAAGPVADDFAKFLQDILGGGLGPGEDPTGQTTAIMQAINDLIAGPDVRGHQSDVKDSIRQDRDFQNANHRESITSVGGSRGTTSAVAEGRL